jgi:threonyl-tRNA synthetase
VKVLSDSSVVFEGAFENGDELLKNIQVKDRVIGLQIDQIVYDLQTKLPAGNADCQLVYAHSKEAQDLVRHTCAHVLAQAVKELFPETQVTIGPVIDSGFYYDFSREKAFTEEDFPVIEKKMKEIIKARFPLKRDVWPVEKAIEFFKGIGESYKCELIEDLVKDQGVSEVSVYQQGEFIDLCKGPHAQNTGAIKAFKLLHTAGAYWRGNENNEMLTRIYGTAFLSKDELKTYLHQLEEAKKRDHRRVGTELDLFSMHAEAPASPFFHPRGAFLYKKVQDVLEQLNEDNGFELVLTPLMMSDQLWKQSGHYQNYKENMYFTKVDERDFAVKPMNCPGHCLIYGNTRHSYRELPLRYCEFGRVHRHERSGVVAGLFRVRSFVQDDAHIFCTEEQVESEIQMVLQMVRKFYELFDFEYSIELSTRPEKYIGSLEVWEKAEKALESALKASGESFQLNPGDGAFYGPKIDFHLKDSIGRTHQCGTIQLDFSMPERFELSYTGADNKAHIPVMIHRAIAGSLERFLGILIEHYAGKFPFWMEPKQAAVLTISEEANEFAGKVFDELKSKGYRVDIDDSKDKLGAKIKKYQSMKTPYMIIIGQKEAAQSVLSLRGRDGSQEQGVGLDQLLARFEQENKSLLKS